MIDEDVTGLIIKAFYTVYNSLGHGSRKSLTTETHLLNDRCEALTLFDPLRMVIGIAFDDA